MHFLLKSIRIIYYLNYEGELIGTDSNPAIAELLNSQKLELFSTTNLHMLLLLFCDNTRSANGGEIIGSMFGHSIGHRLLRHMIVIMTTCTGRSSHRCQLTQLID